MSSAWGPWGAVGLGVVVLVAYFFLQGVVLVAYLAVAGVLGIEAPPAGFTSSLPGIPCPGLALALSVLLVAPVTVTALVLLARYRNPSWMKLLGLSWPTGRQALGWGAAAAGFGVGYDLLGHLLDRPLVPDFMLDAYRTAYFLPLLYLALVVAAPAFEELLFRGWLLPSLAATRLGAAGAVAATAGLWAVIHLQYDLYDMTGILILGIGFGLLRLTTGSTLLAIALHALINLAATLQAAWLARG